MTSTRRKTGVHINNIIPDWLGRKLLKAGVHIRKVSKGLGHTSLTVTERYYAK